MWSRSPLGLGIDSSQVKTSGVPGSAQVSRETSGPAIIFDNQYLRTLVSLGLIGLIGAVWFVGSAIRLARRSKHLAGNDGDLLAACAIACVGSAAGMAFFDSFSFVQATLIFFIVAALGLGTRARARADRDPTGHTSTQPSFRDSVDLDRARHTPIVGRGHRWVAREPATSGPQTCGHTDWRSARGMSFCESRAQPDAQPQESEPDRPPGSAPVLADERRLSLVEEDHLVGTDLRGGADLVRDHRVRRDDRPQAGLRGSEREIGLFPVHEEACRTRRARSIVCGER